MSLAPTTAAALKRSAVMMPYCLQWDLPTGPLRLSEHSPFSFPVDGQAAEFTPVDGNYGVLGAVGPISDGVTSEVPSTSFVLFPPPALVNTVTAALSAAGKRRVRIWEVVLDPITGRPIGDAIPLMIGQSDVPTNTVDKGVRSLTVTVLSRFGRFLRPREGVRLNHGTHQRCKPGEMGMQFMQNVSRTIPWGSTTPTSSLSAAQAAAYARLYGSTYFGVTK
ncbi:hypothetical protein SGCZBJ_12550 [Caulobacter zeae]|uniref:Uncharacterized protein n=1 Tax=Caulobacter zeae TaxID=2055137 RepID=A0A2N5DG55_9CAUL|nr:hypothetical protein [Caulobacter zeae]PLR25060.1 hypothetical protein SGCZBJ_12550 [Caulobacter zeae]